MISFGKKKTFFEHHPIKEDPPVAIGRPAPHSSQLQIQIQLQILTQDHKKVQATAGNQKHTIYNDFLQNKRSIPTFCFIQEPLDNIRELAQNFGFFDIWAVEMVLR